MVRHGLPITTIVVNNACWGMSLHGREILYGRFAVKWGPALVVVAP
jgi:thiamine pyrophosphate-dependent acetolactate synthase large subunit-like protein